MSGTTQTTAAVSVDASEYDADLPYDLPIVYDGGSLIASMGPG